MLSVDKKQRVGVVDFYSLALQARREERFKDYLSLLKGGSKNKDQECTFLLGCYYFFDLCKYGKAFVLFKENINHYKSMALLSTLLEVNFSDKYKTDINESTRLKELIYKSSGNHFAKGWCWYSNLPRDYEKAYEHFLISATEDNDSISLFQVGRYFFSIGNFEKYFEWVHKSAKQKYLSACFDLIDCFYYGWGTSKNYEKVFKYAKKALKFSQGTSYFFFQTELDLSWKTIKERGVDSLVNLHLARCYLSGEKVDQVNPYLSWYFYKHTQDPEGVLELQELEKTTFYGFVKCYKITLTLLCIAKFHPRSLGIPGDIFRMLAKYVWTTRDAKEWFF